MLWFTAGTRTKLAHAAASRPIPAVCRGVHLRREEEEEEEEGGQEEEEEEEE